MTGLEELHGSKVSITLRDPPGYLRNLTLKKIVLKKSKEAAMSKEQLNTHYFHC